MITPFFLFSSPIELLVVTEALFHFHIARRFFLFHAPLLALGDEPSFISNGSENARTYHLRPKAP
jgi:hypothetical protein